MRCITGIRIIKSFPFLILLYKIYIMKINYLLLASVFVFTAVFLSCSSQKKLSVRHNYLNVSFSPSKTAEKIGTNFSIIVQPIDAQDINEDIYRSLSQDGGYEKEEIYRTFINEIGNIPRRKQFLYKKVSSQFKAIDELVYQQLLPAEHANLFKEQVYARNITLGVNGYDGSEAELFSSRTWHAGINPYRVDKRYLSIFNIEFYNEGKEIKDIAIENIQISHGTELLYPFKIDYFENILKNETEKMKYIHRMNMPNLLRVLPGQKVQKIISTPALRLDNDVSVSFISENKVHDFSFSPSLDTFSEEYIYVPFSIPSNIADQYYIVELPNGVIFPLKGKTLYINEKSSNNAKIYSVAFQVTSKNVKAALGENYVDPKNSKKTVKPILKKTISVKL